MNSYQAPCPRNLCCRNFYSINFEPSWSALYNFEDRHVVRSKICRDRCSFTSGTCVAFFPRICTCSKAWNVRKVDGEGGCTIWCNEADHVAGADFARPVWIKLARNGARLAWWGEVFCGYAQGVLVDWDDVLFSQLAQFLHFIPFFKLTFSRESGYTLFFSTAKLAWLIFDKSVPISNGLLAMAQIPKCALSSAAVRPPFPISNISKSLKPPGPAYCASPWAPDAILTTDDHLSVTSPEMRQELPVAAPQVQTESWPQLHIA